MDITERERNISAAVLITVLTISMLYQFPNLIGASNAFIGSGAPESDVSKGELVFMENKQSELVQTGDLASFSYELSESEDIILVRTVIDQRYNDGVRELNIRNLEGQGTIWVPDERALRTNRLSIPFAGYIIEYSNTLPGLIALIVLPLSVLLYYEVEQITSELDEDIFEQQFFSSEK